MSANFEAKKEVVREITEKLNAAKSVVFVDYNKLTVAEVSELRNKCRQANCEYKVYKNTLVKIQGCFNFICLKFQVIIYLRFVDLLYL